MLQRVLKCACAVVLLATAAMRASDVPGGARPAGPPAPTALDAGFAELYNLKFDRAHAEFDRWMQEHPQDPLGPASQLTAYLLQELCRLRILENTFLREEDGRLTRVAARPDPRVRRAFYEQLDRANAQALAHLARNPSHQDALLALTISYGTQADYLNLVEKRPWASLTLFKKSNRYAQALLRVNPMAYDAWTASGFTEYLAGNLPFYARWFVRFDSVQGDKRRAIQQLRMAAVHGRFLRPYAKILLAGVYLREKRPAETVRLLQELRAEFPENRLFAAELARLTAFYPPAR